MCTVSLPPDVNPIAVDKYNISYHIKYMPMYRMLVRYSSDLKWLRGLRPHWQRSYIVSGLWMNYELWSIGGVTLFDIAAVFGYEPLAVAFFTTIPASPDLTSNPGIHGDGQTINPLSHGTYPRRKMTPYKTSILQRRDTFWIPRPKIPACTVTIVNCSLGNSADFPVQFCKSHICLYPSNARGHSGSSVWEMTQLPFYWTVLPVEQIWGQRYPRSPYVYVTSWLFSEARGQKLMPCSGYFKDKLPAACLLPGHDMNCNPVISVSIFCETSVGHDIYFQGDTLKCPALYNSTSLFTGMYNWHWRLFRNSCCFLD